MSAFFTESGKARLIPNEIAPPTTAHAGSIAPSRTSSPRVRPLLFCAYCAHAEPNDLETVWSWLDRRYLWACRDAVLCDLRSAGLTNDGWDR